MNLRDYLASHPAADDRIDLDVDLAGGTVAVAASRRTGWLPVVIGAFFGGLAIVLIASKVAKGITGDEVFAFVFIGLVFTALAAPPLWKRLRGGATWRRAVRIDGGSVHGSDSFGKGTDAWRVPLSEYEGIRHRVTAHSGVAASGTGTRTVRYDVLEMTHRDPGLTIPLWKRMRTTTGGMGLSAMIRAGRAGDREAVESALNSRDNPALRAFALDAAGALGVPLLDPPESFAEAR